MPILEKDIWVCWALEALFKLEHPRMVFKGGTSLSKAYELIQSPAAKKAFDVYNGDYLQAPPEVIAERARRAADWLGERVLRRALPVPNMDRLRGPARD